MFCFFLIIPFVILMYLYLISAGPIGLMFSGLSTSVSIRRPTQNGTQATGCSGLLNVCTCG